MSYQLNLVNLETNERTPITKSEFDVGRGRDADLSILDPEISRQQFRIRRAGDQYFLEPLSDSVPTFCDDQQIADSMLLGAGMQICSGRTRLLVELLKDESRQSEPPLQTYVPTMVPADAEPLSDFSNELPQYFEIEEHVVIGRDKKTDVVLPHVQVSRQHARIYQKKGEPYLQDQGSANGTFLNGELVTVPCPLKRGSFIGIGPYTLTYLKDRLVPVTRANDSQLEARGLTRVIPDNDNPGSLKTILDDVSLVIRPREFVCLLGPSGSGKSTLLSALSARTPANRGQVLINGQSLYENFESLKTDIAVVPQRDILHEELTVEVALQYTARLRLPADTTQEEIHQQIDDLLKSVGLEEHRNKPIAVLSGGQRRRASLANELISNPSLLFLDEVTSGLDEQSDREMMQLFRKLADSGKTVVCVTHTLVNIPDTCHLVVLLTAGGKLGYVGPPQEALTEFKIERLGETYQQLEDVSKTNQLQSNAKKSSTYKQFVTDRLTAQESVETVENASLFEHYWHRQFRTFCSQFPILLNRYWAVFRSDRNALGGLILQCLVVAVVLWLVFGNVADAAETVFRQASLACNVLFVLAVSSFWFGCNNSAKEIVKERGIYTKELQANLDPTSYVVSKFLLQSLIVTIQSVTLLILVRWWCQLPGDFLVQLGILIAGGTAGIAVGLFISSLSTTEETALTLVPLVLIPQIILSDVFVELTGLSKFLGTVFASNYWIYGALRGTLPDVLIEQLNSPLVPPANLNAAIFAVGLQVFTLGVTAILAIHIRDRTMAATNKSFAQALQELALVRLISKQLQQPTESKET